MVVPAYSMEELTPQHRAEVNAAFLNDANLIKWDNTGREQDPAGLHPMTCIWRHVWNGWNNKLQRQQEEMVGAVKGNKGMLSDVGSAIPAAPPANAPHCPRHSVRMRYESASGKFICPEADCDIMASSKSNKDRFEDAVLKGDFELVHVGDDKYLIRHLPTGAIIDFGDKVVTIGSGELHGQDNEFVVMVQFTGRRNATSEYSDGDGND